MYAAIVCNKTENCICKTVCTSTSKFALLQTCLACYTNYPHAGFLAIHMFQIVEL